MKPKTEHILIVLKVIAWIAMIGYAIEAGSKIISLGVSFVNPEAAKNLYKGLNFYELRQTNQWVYVGIMTLIISILALKVEVWRRLITLFDGLKLQSPFQMQIANQLEIIAFLLLDVWIFGMITSGYLDWINKHYDFAYQSDYSNGEYIFMAGIVYIISQIFKRGVELQEENELTV